MGTFTTIFLKSSVVVFALLLTQFVHAQAPNSWLTKASIPTIGRGAGVAFAIGSKGYLGTGLNFSQSPPSLKDFWEYDPSNDTWTQKADFGGGGRSGAVGFSIGSKGYIATGMDTTSTRRKDIWEYDPSGNSWTQKTSMPGAASARNYAVGFAVNGKGYVATGTAGAGDLDDCWEFDPGGNSWTQKMNVPGGARSSATAFGIGTKGYVGTGYQAGPVNDFYEFDPSGNTWTPKASVGSALRSDATSFVLSGHGFICAGYVNSTTGNDLLEYDPVANTWTPRAALPIAGLNNHAGFAVGNHGYVSTGYDPLFTTTPDLYEYTDSSAVTAVRPVETAIAISVFPNPIATSACITVETENADEAVIEIFTTDGKRLSTGYCTKEMEGTTKTVFRFSRNGLPAGIYLYSVKTAGGKTTIGKLLLE